VKFYTFDELNRLVRAAPGCDKLAATERPVLSLPAVIRLLRNAVRATQVGHLPAGLAFAHDLQNLFVGELAPLHRAS
jgi:hypothetical protein